MAEGSDPHRRKTRTRQHVIADLGVNFVERQILFAGYTVERIIRDYGLDLFMQTFAPNGEVENEFVGLQVKATDHVEFSPDGLAVRIRLHSADFRTWLMQLMPVILVVYDAVENRAFWIDVQQYAKMADLDADEIGETVTIHLPSKSVFTPDAVRSIRDWKQQVSAELERLRDGESSS